MPVFQVNLKGGLIAGYNLYYPLCRSIHYAQRLQPRQAKPELVGNDITKEFRRELYTRLHLTVKYISLKILPKDHDFKAHNL